MGNYSVSGKLGLTVLGACALVFAAWAQDKGDAAPAIRADAPLQYVVKKGDTLWGISHRFLRDAWQWPEIWYVNGQVANPHLIYPGDVLSLEVLNGRPHLVRAQPVPTGAERLEPQVHATLLPQAIPAIPLEAIRDFLSSPRVVTADELRKAPYVLGFQDDRSEGSAGDLMYVRNLRAGASDYAVIHVGDVLVNPDTGEKLGYEAIPVGAAQVRNVGDPGRATLASSKREALVGDFLLPAQSDDFDAYFYPRPPKNPVNARVISVFGDMSVIGQWQIVAIDLGSRDGMEPGTVLTVLAADRVATDPYTHRQVKLPGEPAATAMVFKTTPRVCFALIMEGHYEVQKLDRVVSPVELAQQ